MDYIKEFDGLLLDESKSDGELLSIARNYIAELQGRPKLFMETVKKETTVVMDIDTIAFDDSIDFSKVGKVALCMEPKELRALAEVLESAGDKRFLPAIKEWLDSPMVKPHLKGED